MSGSLDAVEIATMIEWLSDIITALNPDGPYAAQARLMRRRLIEKSGAHIDFKATEQ